MIEDQSEANEILKSFFWEIKSPIPSYWMRLSETEKTYFNRGNFIIPYIAGERKGRYQIFRKRTRENPSLG